jgi:hypothetical protein
MACFNPVFDVVRCEHGNGTGHSEVDSTRTRSYAVTTPKNGPVLMSAMEILRQLSVATQRREIRENTPVYFRSP